MLSLERGWRYSTVLEDAQCLFELVPVCVCLCAYRGRELMIIL